MHTSASIDRRNELDSKNGVSPSTTSILIQRFPKGKYRAPTLGKTALFPNLNMVSDFFQFICF
jgi:hypothetical protein